MLRHEDRKYIGGGEDGSKELVPSVVRKKLKRIRNNRETKRENTDSKVNKIQRIPISNKKNYFILFNSFTDDIPSSHHLL